MATKRKWEKNYSKMKKSEKTNSDEIKGNDQQDFFVKDDFTFPLLKVADNENFLPRYSAILKRNNQESVGLEDLHTLQFELETLLSTAVFRIGVFQEKIRVFSKAKEKQDDDNKKGKLDFSHVQKRELSPGRCTKLQDSLLKTDTGSSNSQSTADDLKNDLSPTAIYARTPQNHFLPEFNKSNKMYHYTSTVVFPKNDTANKFWTSVEPYCSDIQIADLEKLDELIHEHDNDEEFQTIPPLGHHYSLWQKQEIEEDHLKTNINKASLSSLTTLINPAKIQRNVKPFRRQIDENVIKSPSVKGSDIDNLGTLTQRLLTSLIEENPIDSNQASLEKKRGVDPTKSNKNYAVASVSLMEQRVRKELEQQGLFDPNEKKDPADDEILTELKKCQADLRTITTYNITQLKRLRKLAAEEIVRQDIKRKLQFADNKVLEVYRKITALKQMKLPRTKELIDHAWKCLTEREFLLRQIDKF